MQLRWWTYGTPSLRTLFHIYMCTCTKRISSVSLRISLVQCYTQIVQFTCNTKRLDNAFVQSYVHVFVSHTISYLRQVLQAPHQHTSTALTPGDQHRKPSAEGVWSALLGTPFYHCTWGVTINIKEKTIMKCWSVKVLSKQPPFSCEYCQEFYLASINIGKFIWWLYAWCLPFLVVCFQN